jgi:hypothetical protein
LLAQITNIVKQRTDLEKTEMHGLIATNTLKRCGLLGSQIGSKLKESRAIREAWERR